MGEKSIIVIVTEWDIVAARQLGRNIAKELGFDIVDQARITTAISELARNIYLYACSGKIEIEKAVFGDKVGMIIIASDEGPGIEDIRLVMEDGYSTLGGLGAGLPGVKRLMDRIDIQSAKEKGTIVRIEKWLE